ncbi:MAG: hypothetical protein LH473_00780 [Chitinophagales bacterium]|nr:hypothetical protein [Chitinophagales bacterium]
MAEQKLNRSQTGVQQVEAETKLIPRTRDKSRKRNWLYESLDISKLVHYDTVIRNLPFIFFIASIGFVYIWNSHYAEKNVREINNIEKQLNEKRWEYMTSKSELEFISKQSEVATMVAPTGLKELQAPPKKIVVKSNEQ